jgi:hypothetical protein
LRIASSGRRAHDVLIRLAQEVSANDLSREFQRQSLMRLFRELYQFDFYDVEGSPLDGGALRSELNSLSGAFEKAALDVVESASGADVSTIREAIALLLSIGRRDRVEDLKRHPDPVIRRLTDQEIARAERLIASLEGMGDHLHPSGSEHTIKTLRRKASLEAQRKSIAHSIRGSVPDIDADYASSPQTHGVGPTQISNYEKRWIGGLILLLGLSAVILFINRYCLRLGQRG